MNRAIGILETVQAYWRPCESLVDTATRMLFEEAMAQTKNQKDAARLLRIEPRVLCYYKRRWPEIFPTALRQRIVE